MAPWEMAKDQARKADLDDFLYRLLEAVRLIATVVSPGAAAGVGAHLLACLASRRQEPSVADLEWGRLVPGSPLGAIEPLFPRLDKAGVDGAVAPPAKKEGEDRVRDDTPEAERAGRGSGRRCGLPPPLGDKIDIADFAKVELRAALVLEAEKIPGSKKLLKLQVDLGDEKRQIVAGIAESYAPETLVGRKVVIVANLKPAKLMGVESNGMVLAGSHDGKAVLCSFEAEIAPGSKVR